MPYLTIIPGLKSKFRLTISNSSSSDLIPVPYVITAMERGAATPIAYDT